jgi:phosphate transport system permease protein
VITSSAFSSDLSLATLVGNSLLTTLVALALATPIAIFAALYLSEFASARARSVVLPLLRVIAGVPPVVYGYFAVVMLVPAFAWRFSPVIAAGLALGVMMLPLVLTNGYAAVSAVPQHLRDAAYALGGGKFSTATLVVIPAAKSRLIAAVLLAASRAVGETMIVLAVFSISFPKQFGASNTLTTFLTGVRAAAVRPDAPSFGTFCIAGSLLLLLAFALEFSRASLGKPSTGDAP